MVPDRDRSSSILRISSTSLLYVFVVHHFDMVNNLDTVETSHTYVDSKHMFTFYSLILMHMHMQNCTGSKMKCSIQPLTVSIAMYMYIEWSEANLAL